MLLRYSRVPPGRRCCERFALYCMHTGLLGDERVVLPVESAGDIGPLRIAHVQRALGGDRLNMRIARRRSLGKHWRVGRYFR